MAPNQQRTVRYLVVDDVLADVPETAPEVDGIVDSAGELVALLARVGVAAPPQAIFLRTPRPGSKKEWRWQALAAVSELPPGGLVVKVLRSGLTGGGPNAAAIAAAAAAGGVAAGGAAAVAVTGQQPARPSGGGGGGPFGIGRLLRGVARVVTGDGGGGRGGGGVGGGGGGSAGAAAATSAAAMHAGGNTRWMTDRRLEDEMMRGDGRDDADDERERAEIDGMLQGPDRDGDGVPDAAEEQQEQEQQDYGAFENQEEDNGGNDNDNDNANDNDGAFDNENDNDGGDGGGDDDGGGFGDDD